MPWNAAQKDHLPPRAPAPLAAPQQTPSIPLGPPGHADNDRAWSRDGAQMTPELHQDTKPYLDAVMKMGGDFKAAHASKYDEKTEAKQLKRYNKENPLPANATDEQKEAHAQGAQQMLQEFQERLPTNIAVHDATRELRNDFKDYDENNYDEAAQNAFEERYAELCQQAGRQEPSPLEKALPRNSPLRTKLDPLTGGLRDPSSGLYANMVEMGEGASKKNVLIFGGTGVGGALSAQVQADAGQFLGGVPKAYQQAAKLTEEVGNNLPEGEKLETAGHSLGGGLAHYAALKNGGIKATCFNAAALGGGCKASIGGNIDQAKDNVRHINVRGDGVGDGIGQVRVPVQKAADGLSAGVQSVKAGVQQVKEKAVNFVAEKADALGQDIDRLKMNAGVLKDQVAGAIPKPLRQAGAQAGQAVGNAVDQIASNLGQPVRQAAQAVGGAASQAGQQVQNAGRQIASGASALGRQAQEAAGELGSHIGFQARQAANALPGPVKQAGQQVAGAASAAKSSVRDMLRGAKDRVSSNLNNLKEGVQGAARQASDAIGNSKAGKALSSARDSAVKLHENLGFNQGKLAIPHQYGGCITLENGGKVSPIGNHLTGALAKAYDRNAQQNQSVRNKVSIGQRGGGGGHGHGV